MTAKTCCSRRTISVETPNSDSAGPGAGTPSHAQTMKVENQPVWLEHQKGHIKLFGEEVYQERKQRAAENRAGKLKAFERKGLL